MSSIIDFHLFSLGHNPGFDLNLAGGSREMAIRDAQMLNYQEDAEVKGRLNYES